MCSAGAFGKPSRYRVRWEGWCAHTETTVQIWVLAAADPHTTRDSTAARPISVPDRLQSRISVLIVVSNLSEHLSLPIYLVFRCSNRQDGNYSVLPREI